MSSISTKLVHLPLLLLFFSRHRARNLGRHLTQPLLHRRRLHSTRESQHSVVHFYSMRLRVSYLAWFSHNLLERYMQCTSWICSLLSSSSDLWHADGPHGAWLMEPSLRLPRPHPEVRRLLRGSARMAESHPLHYVSTEIPAYSDTLGTWEKCHCNQIVTVTRGSSVMNQSFGTWQKCHCKRGNLY